MLFNMKSIIIVYQMMLTLCYSISRVSQMNTTSSISSIDHVNLNKEEITITSFKYNPTTVSSAWVDRIFGSKSIHNQFLDYEVLTSNDPITEEEHNLMRQAMIDSIHLTSQQLLPSCSFEMLGFSYLDNREPFTSESKKLGPITGRALLNINDISVQVDCFYRAVYETWKPEVDRSKPNHWATLFYCPVITSDACHHINKFTLPNKNVKLLMELKMFLKRNLVWYNSFTTRLLREEVMAQKNKIGVCVAIPYASSDREKHIGNAAMLREWIKYYVNLDMKVFIYDRSGNNYDSVYNNGIDSKLHDNIVYYNYTMRGFLNPHLPYLFYDNNEQMGPTAETRQQVRTIGERFARQGVDKTLTLTQCRFEAKANYGIDRVLVADFDEFLFCPSTNASTKLSTLSLKQNIYKLVDSLDQQGYDQISFSQRIIANKTESMRDCIIDRARNNESLFNCISSTSYLLYAHSVKSIHVGHKCPLTGYHQACPIDAPRSYDCECSAYNNLRDPPCFFIHLSTKSDHYKRFHYSYPNEKDFEDIRNSTNELLLLNQ